MEVKTKLSAKELFEIYPEESRVELIDGEVYEMPAPNPIHQRVLFRLARKTQEYIEIAGIQGEVFLSPIDVVLSEDTVLQPDIVYVSDLSKVRDKIDGAPELVVEVVSPSTLKRDISDKMRVYQDYGVKEYWLVFPLEKTIVIYEFTQKGYEAFSFATEKGKIKSKVLEGFEIEVDEVFGGI